MNNCVYAYSSESVHKIFMNASHNKYEIIRPTHDVELFI